MAMPDLLSTLAGQVQQYSEEYLTCELHQQSRVAGTPSLDLVAAFRHSRHAPRGLVEVLLSVVPSRPSTFAWPCRSAKAIAQLLDSIVWSPFCRYFLVLRRGAAGDDSPWPPPPTKALLPGMFASADADNFAGVDGTFQFCEVLRRMFSPKDGYHINVVYLREFARGEHPLAFASQIEYRAWQQRVVAACAEAVYTLVGEC